MEDLIDVTPVLDKDQGNIPIKPGGRKLARYDDKSHTCSFVVPEGL